MTVACVADRKDLRRLDPVGLTHACDVVEIRLDLVMGAGDVADSGPWPLEMGVPVLFTARRESEGGATGLTDTTRARWLIEVMDIAAALDIELACVPAMEEVIAQADAHAVPWIASFHDFESLPARAKLDELAVRARESGAAVFKMAAQISSPAELAALADFQATDHGLPKAVMGMGPLGPVSRLLCAQLGSVLNYGSYGRKSTAPGQWEAAFLKQAIARLEPPPSLDDLDRGLG